MPRHGLLLLYWSNIDTTSSASIVTEGVVPNRSFSHADSGVHPAVRGSFCFAAANRPPLNFVIALSNKRRSAAGVALGGNPCHESSVDLILLLQGVVIFTDEVTD